MLADLCAPQGVAVNDSGNVYIGDVCNNRIRLLTKHPLNINNISSTDQGINIYPNPCQNYSTIKITAGITEPVDVVIENITGTIVYKLNTPTNKSFTIQFDWPPGVYIINATTSQQHFNQKVIVE